jgi:carboxymethylenebutenolidase
MLWMPRRLRWTFACLALAALALVGPGAARADDSCPTPHELRTYYQPASLPAGDDTRCDVAQGKCSRLELKGFLYMPAADKLPAPILIFNHGSEKNPGTVCPIGTYFASLGYIVFVPHRRGHGRSTGVYLDRYTEERCSHPGQGNLCKMEYLHKQVDDVEAAIAYVRSLPGADRERIAIMGHSFGGITTAFANAKDLGQRAVVVGAGASQSWEGNPYARADMTAAARAAVAPAFYLEPLNDHSIDPTIELARAAGEACRQFQSALFPAVDSNGDGRIDGADYAPVAMRDRAHGSFAQHVDEWGAAAHEFMMRYFKHPAARFDSLCRGTSHALH